MRFYLMGLAAFTLYILYDVNSVLWKKRLPKSFFALGTALIAVSTTVLLLGILRNNEAMLCRSRLAALFLIPAAAGFALMIYSLFFALPFDETYVHPQGKMAVYDKGMYALCRHPGVIWFCLMYMGLALAWNTPLVWGVSLFYCALNIGYVVLQDRWTFLHTFDNYEEYQKSTPFLIPTGKSIRTAWKTRR